MAVTIYTTPTCGFCRAAKNYLSTRKIPFRELDVTKNPEWARDLTRKSGQTGVPVIDVNGTIIVGFDVNRLNRALGIKG